MSIATAIEHAREKIKVVYTKCEEKGATLPEKQNLENLPACLDTIKNESQKVNAYYYNSDTSANKKVLLTNVGYEIPIDEDFSTMRFSFIRDNGWVVLAHYDSSSSYKQYFFCNTPWDPQNFGIVDGKVDPNVYAGMDCITTTSQTTSTVSGVVIPFSFLNGVVIGEVQGSGNGMKYPETRAVGPQLMLYNYKHYSLYRWGSQSYVDQNMAISITDYMYFVSGISSDYARSLNIINEDSSYTQYYPTGLGGWRSLGISKDRETHFLLDPYPNSKLLKKVTIIDGVLAEEDIKTLTNDYPTTFRCEIYIQLKTLTTTDNGFIAHALTGEGFYMFNIDEQSLENSDVTFHTWSQNVLDEIGTRTIYKMQVFYDGTFSFDLDEGTTLMCRFINTTEVEILEVIEPFIVPDDSTIYHRTFTPHKFYWYQRYSDNRKTAPLSSAPWGTYEPREAVTNYLAADFDKTRFNSTVLTGFLTGETVVEEGRELVEVKTALPE